MASRRQNSSCDQCRRSKRKCASRQGAPRESGHACLNCFHLGYECTFEFVTARVKQKRKGTIESGDRLHPFRLKRHRQDQPVSSLRNDLFAGVTGDSNPYEALDMELDFPADFDGLNDLNEAWSFLAGENPDSAATSDWTTRSGPSASSSRLRIDENGLSGLWSGSPIQLLNSNFTANLLGTCLDDVYRSMMYGIESRYLSYTCNPFAPSHKYCFGDGDQLASPVAEGSPDLSLTGSRDPTTSSGAMQAPVSSPQPSTPFDFNSLLGLSKNPGQGALKFTFVGLARFLDHFGALYGNRVDSQTRKEDRDALIAAQQAFALQWSPCDTPGTKGSIATSATEERSSTNNSQVFTTAWFIARSRIMNTRPHRSFIRLYAMLLFHMTDAPEQAKDAMIEKNNILSQCLYQLLDLKTLVEDYCQHLGPSSTYRRLLDSSVKVFQWFAYVKDTVASIVSDRECILPDAPVASTCQYLSYVPD